MMSHIDSKWLDIIYNEISKPMIDKISTELANIKYTPSIDKWFNWCRYTDLDNIKVIVIGQDPYHKEGWSNGLSFSCNIGIPPSLHNIYKCLLRYKLIDRIPDNGNLESWANQGVLLLNAAFTTELHVPVSHMDLWLPYTRYVINEICKYYYDNNDQLIFMIWGEFAKDLAKLIDSDYHIVMHWIHPSQLTQTSTNNIKFINCNHFSECNKLLKSDLKSAVDWNTINLKFVKNMDNKILTSDYTNRILHINDKHHIVFTDGSCHPNNRSDKSRAGWALLFMSGEFTNTKIYGNLNITKYNASNIRAEGMAIIRSLETADNSLWEWNRITIITDCEFWIDMLEKYMWKWDINTFNNKANPDLTNRMNKIYTKLKKNKEVVLLHIKSHNKSGWNKFEEGTSEKFCYKNNDYVDKLCKYARIKLQPNDEIITNSFVVELL